MEYLSYQYASNFNFYFRFNLHSLILPDYSYICIPHFRLVDDEERRWTDENVDAVALKHFPSVNKDESLKRPILFSNWLSKDYIPVDREELRDYVKARLKVNNFVFTI